MNCIRCGRETPGDQCFCEDCLMDMEKYPVKPGTVVQLPPRRESSPTRKAPRRRTAPLEEQVKLLRKRLRITAVCLAVSILLSIAGIYFAFQYAMEDHFDIGQNYSSMTTPTQGNDY